MPPTNATFSPNQVLVDLTVDALDRREWPRTEAEIHLLRSAVFAAQAIAHVMIANGGAEEVEQIRRHVSMYRTEPSLKGQELGAIPR